MSGLTVDALTTLPSIPVGTDYHLVGRGTQTYKYPRSIYIPTPMPTLIGVTDQGENTRRGVVSDDPLNWWDMVDMTNYTNGGGTSWTDVIYIPARKEAWAVGALNNGGNRNVLAVSRDGRSWAGRANDITTVNTGIAYAPSLGMIAVCRSAGVTTSDRLWTSTDGMTWTNRTLPTVSIVLQCIAWSPTIPLFVTMGQANAVFTSPDGVTWTSRTGPTGGGGGSAQWRRVLWAGGSVNKFLAFDGNNVTTSADGITWTAAVSTGIAGNGRGWAYDPVGNILVASDANTNNLIVHSANAGTSWASHTVTGGWQDVTWSASLGLFVAVGVGILATSPNGSTWTLQSANPIPNNNGFTRICATQ